MARATKASTFEKKLAEAMKIWELTGKSTTKQSGFVQNF